MIELIGVTKVFTEGRRAAKVVFGSTSVNLPSSGRIGILGGRGQGKSILLQMLARNEFPDRGRILSPPVMSPVVNSGGLFHPQLSAIDNLSFIARTFGMTMEQLLITVTAFQPVEMNLNQPLRMQNAVSRRNLEAAVVTVLPFDGYIYDDIGQFEPSFIARCFDAAAQRQAPAVFSTVNPKLMRQFADFVVVISDAKLHPFKEVDEAIEFFDRRAESDRESLRLVDSGVGRATPWWA